jgi:small GTP-binding protein
MRILNEKQELLLKEERQLLQKLQIVLVNFGASPEDQQTLIESIKQLDELFLLVVVGEFNAGKSAFINALLGQALLKEGVTPTTTHINLLRYGTPSERTIVNDEQQILTLPVDWLEEISIVDTPGTNAIIRTHEQITSQFVPRSDLVLFITSADRSFTESERAFLEKIRDWGKKVVFIVNKIDILQSDIELQQVQGYIAENAKGLLGIDPEIFPVSSRQALWAKQGEPGYWEQSRFEPVEKYIQETLDEISRLRLKLLNPLGVAAHLAMQHLQIIETRLALISEDTQMLSDVEAQLSLYKQDMERDFTFRMADIENVLYEMEQRGQEYFDETFRLIRVFDLLSKEKIRKDFEQIVVADVPQRIENKVSELIDWLVDSDLRQWQAVTNYLADRRRAHRDRIVGDSGTEGFHYDRERLMAEVGREAQRVVDTYDKRAEARYIAEGAQAAVAASAALEIGAVGLGTLVAVLASTAAADITGVLLASLVAALGLFIIPARRKVAKVQMHQKIDTLRVHLIDTLQSQFEHEIERSLQNIQNTIAPYTRFVRSERDKLSDVKHQLEGIRTALSNVRRSIEEL